MKKVFVLIWFCVMFVAAQAQVEKGVSSTGQLGTTGDTRSFVDEKGHIVTRPRLTRTGKIIRTTIASVITSPTGTVTTITAISGGNVLSDGGAEVTARGVCWSMSPNPTLENSIGHTTDGIGVGEFTSELTGLLECTTYYVRAYATNSVGTTYGEQETFNTLPDMEYAINFGYSVDFGKVTIVNTSATSAVWKNASNQTVGEWVSGTTPVLPVGTYTVELTSEDCGTNSVTIDILSSPICAVDIVNINETGYTPTFSGKYISALKDVDNNTYNVVQIGDQCWIKENLRTTRFANGTLIERGETSSDRSETTPYRYYTNYDENNVLTYGYLYNWPAVMNGATSSAANPSAVQGVCPNGWHVPSSAELTTLTDFVSNQSVFLCNGVEDNIAAALTTTTGWQDATADCVAGSASETSNYTGFSVLPAGDAQGVNVNFGRCTYFWSTTEDNSNVSFAEHLALCRDYPMTGFLSINKYYGYSVRCVRNEGCELSMDYTINLGNSDDFGRVTINSTNATAASWKDSNGVEIGTWVSGKTDILPVGKYTVELTGDCGTRTITGIRLDVSPICSVESINEDNEIAFEPTSYSPSYTGKFISKMKDIDENEYNVLQMGKICWIRENLKTKTFSNGTAIQHGANKEVSNNIAYYEYPANDEGNVAKYGLLYNWPAAMCNQVNLDPAKTVQGVCPDGWHLLGGPDMDQLGDDFDISKFICGGEEDWMAKALSTTTDWNSSSVECAVGNDLTTNNTTGAAMLPAGYRSGTHYEPLGNNGFLWLALGTNTTGAINMKFYYDNPEADIPSVDNPRSDAYSVRCIRGKICDPAIFDYTINMGNSDDFGRVTINSTNAISASWKDSNGVVIGTWIEGKTDILPVGTYTIVLSLNCGGTQTLSFDVLSSPICSSVSELNDNEISHTASYSGRYLKAMKDVDENSYNVVQIGSQCWITENLHATHFADGTEIPLGSGTVSYDVPVRYKSGRFDTDNACGYLYNWSAAMHGASSSSANPSNIQGICPVGWHMPSSAEWTQLTDYVSSKSAYWCDASDNTKIGKALASTLYWPAVSTECVPANTLSTNNTTGFNAIPAGVFDDNNNKAAGVDSLVYYWSATEVDAHHANVVGVVYLLPNVYVPTTGNAKNSVVSVRCLRGEGATPCETSMDYTINMGNSADFGRVTINNTNATSASWKDSNDVEIGTWVSGKTDILPVGKYTVELTGISCNKTLSFEILSSPICTVDAVNSNETGSNGQISQLKDVENHTYNVVQIGSQCWTKENMRSKTYAGGDTLGYMHEVSDYPHYDYPNGIAANSDTYGLLYNWYAAMHNVNASDAEPSGVQGICPDGWHVPSAAEFTTLTNYVSSKESFLCGGDATKIAKALSGNTGWLDKSTLEAIAAQAGMEGELSECMVSYDLTTNNATGFSMSAAGICRGTTYNYDLQPGLSSFGLAAVLWTTSSSNDNSAVALNWYGFGETISSTESGSYKAGYWSVRCVRGAGNNTPSVTTAAISDTNCTSIICGGNVISDGGSEVTARGVCWSSNGALNLDVDHNHTTDGVGTGEFTSEITGLEAGNTYYIRAYATNAMGTFYGETMTYTHTVEIDYTVHMGNSPDFGRVTINTADVTSAIWKKGDEVIGTWTTKTDILPVGTYSVEITTPCISTTISGIEILSSPICSADAVGANEGAYTPDYSGTYINKLTDIDDNEYTLVQVGTQCWLREDMRTKHYADGVAITPAYSDNGTAEHVPHYINHYEIVKDGEEMHISVLFDSPDLLYNGFAALKMNFAGSDANPSGVQGLCPDGWHVPSWTEMAALSDYVGLHDAYYCNGDASKLGKALASHTGWMYDESDEDFKDCSLGTELSTNNATGLSLSAGGILAIFPFPEGLASGYYTTSPSDKEDFNGGDGDGSSQIGKELLIAATFTTGENFDQNTCAKVGFMGVRCVRGAGNNTPSVTTSAVSAVTGTTATCGGNVTADGGSTVTARGVCWKKDNNGRYDKFPTVNDSKTTDGTGTGSFTSAITGLTAGTKYYVRAYATNAMGTFYGDTVAFIPYSDFDYTINMGNSIDFGKITINSTNIISATWKNAADDVIGDWTSGNTDILPVGTYSVEYTNPNGTATVTGIEIKSSPICTVSSINANETGSGSQISQLKDIDNNTYNVVQIGSQCFMKDNLKTTRYADGTAIPSAGTETTSVDKILYSNAYTLDGTPSTEYGFMYSSYAALKNSIGSDANPSGLQGVCPDGWHLPSKAEFENLETYVGQQSEWLCNGGANATGKALCSQTSDWFTLDDFIALNESPNWPNVSDATNPDRYTDCSICTNVSGNNATGLTLTPNGFMAMFTLPVGVSANYWTSTVKSDQELYVNMTYAMEDHAELGGIHKDLGLLSVRCIRGAGLNTPSVTTSAVSGITRTTATSGGNVTADGGSAVTARGVCWSTSKYPTINDSKTTDGTGTGSFTSAITGLTADTKYYVRAYATNALGTFYGDTVSFTTIAAVIPTVELIVATPNPFTETEIQIIAEGQILSDGGAEVTATGICWGTEPGLSIQASSMSLGNLVQDPYFIAYTSGSLEDCTDYYVRLYATNSVGTGYSEEISLKAMMPSGMFYTSEGYEGGGEQLGNSEHFGKIAIMLHDNVDKISWKTMSGEEVGTSNVTPVLPVGDYNAFTYHECDGVYYLLNHTETTTENNAGYVNPSHMDMVSSSADFRISASPICRVSSKNANETAYATSYSGTYINKLTDASANEYNVVQIGEQCWMRENLRTTKYADGADILASNCYYPNDDASNVATYGYLYNWSAVMNGASSSATNPSNVQGICPDGWHVPSTAEWEQLATYLTSTKSTHSDGEGSYTYRCNDEETAIAKALASATGWETSTASCGVGNALSPNNRSGFGAMPAGDSGSRHDFGQSSYFWTTNVSSTETTFALFCGLNYEVSSFVTNVESTQNDGFSVRCVRDAGSSPTATLPAISSITTGSLAGSDEILGSDGRAYGVANITSSGGASIIERGMCWSRNHNPSLDDEAVAETSGHSSASYNMDDEGNITPVTGDVGVFYTEITGLALGECQKYYIRPYATNSVGTVYGEEMELVTGDMIITYTQGFGYYDMTEVPGTLVWKTSDGDVIGHWGVGRTDTLPADDYRLIGTSECGTVINYSYPFVVPSSPICQVESVNESNETRYTPSYSGNYIQHVTDVDNNKYGLVQIGNQCWMRENLRTKHFANNTLIDLGDNTTSSNTVAYRYNPADDETNVVTYGYLYNWQAVMNGATGSTTNPSNVQGICPDGWHVPSVAEWQQLIDHLNSKDDCLCNETADLIAKSIAANTNYWNTSTTDCAPGNTDRANDYLVFTAMPAGYFTGSSHSQLGVDANIWTSTKVEGSEAVYSLIIPYDAPSVFLSDNSSTLGFSVRCLRD